MRCSRLNRARVAPAVEPVLYSGGMPDVLKALYSSPNTNCVRLHMLITFYIIYSEVSDEWVCDNPHCHTLLALLHLSLLYVVFQ